MNIINSYVLLVRIPNDFCIIVRATIEDFHGRIIMLLANRHRKVA